MEAGGVGVNSRCVGISSSCTWSSAGLCAAAKCELQRDPAALLCPVSLCVGVKVMPDAGVPRVSAGNPLHPPRVSRLGNCTTSEPLPRAPGLIPIFCKWVEMGAPGVSPGFGGCLLTSPSIHPGFTAAGLSKVCEPNSLSFAASLGRA